MNRSQPSLNPNPAPISTWEWSPGDRYSVWTTGLFVALVGAAALALVGLPPIDLHGPNHYAGVMVPTCGLTRAVRFFTLGDLGRAWDYNPAVFALAAVGAVGVVRTGIGVLAGRWLNPPSVDRRALVVVATLLAAVLWVNQQAHADLLMAR